MTETRPFAEYDPTLRAPHLEICSEALVLKLPSQTRSVMSGRQ